MPLASATLMHSTKHSLATRALLTAAFLGLTISGAAAASACGGESLDPAREHDSAVGTVGPDGRVTLPDGNVVLPDGAPAPPLEDSGDIDPPRPLIDGGKAFDFAPAYVAALGPSSRSDAGHSFATNTPASNPKGTICINCHKAGGTADGMPFMAGGSIKYQSNNAPAPMVEVRLKAFISTNAVSAYTDNDGNWFIPQAVATDAGVGFSVRPGIRNDTSVRTMGPSPAIGACNKCHIAYL